MDADLDQTITRFIRSPFRVSTGDLPIAEHELALVRRRALLRGGRCAARTSRPSTRAAGD